jgi:hypothetical protein
MAGTQLSLDCVFGSPQSEKRRCAYDGLRLRKIANSLIEEPIHPVEASSLRRSVDRKALACAKAFSVCNQLLIGWLWRP